MSQKLDLPCSVCGNVFKCDPHYAQNPKCPECIQEEFAKKHAKEEVAEVIKNSVKGDFEFNFDLIALVNCITVK